MVIKGKEKYKILSKWIQFQRKENRTKNQLFRKIPKKMKDFVNQEEVKEYVKTGHESSIIIMKNQKK